jgi:hypothetical protein
MPVAEDKTPKPEKVNYANVPGFHAIRADGTFLGTYETAADAQAFIDGHVVPGGAKAEIVAGKEPEEAAE